jgi:acetyltransferase-like isoleucine patch superfamily enzyme
LTRKAFNLLMAVLLLPLIAGLWLCVRLKLTDYRSATQVLALIPDFLGGILARRCWYRATLTKCGSHLVVSWQAAIENRNAIIGDRVYVGPRCSLGLVKVGDDVLLSANVIITSGVRQHGMKLSGQPMNRQCAASGKSRVSIGSDCWIGAGALIGADIESGCVVGMGSVVARALSSPNGIYAGNPARHIRDRPTGSAEGADR